MSDREGVHLPAKGEKALAENHLNVHTPALADYLHSADREALRTSIQAISLNSLHPQQTACGQGNLLKTTPLIYKKSSWSGTRNRKSLIL